MTRALSTVIVTFATPGDVLHECIASVRCSAARAGTPVEIICIDNGSGDSAAAESLSDEYISMGWNAGFARAANRGVAHARGDVVLVLNPDARVDRETVGLLISALDSYSGRALVGGWLVSGGDQRPQVDAYLSWSSSASRLLRRGRYLRYLTRASVSGSVEVQKVSGGALVGSREWLLKLGPFDETFFLYGEDDDLSRRARAAGLARIAVPSATVFHIGGFSSREDRSAIERARVDAGLRVIRRHHGRLAVWAGIFELALATVVGLVAVGCTSSASRAARRARLRELRRWVESHADAPPLVGLTS